MLKKDILELSSDNKQLLISIVKLEHTVDRSDLFHLFKSSSYNCFKLNRGNFDKVILAFTRLKNKPVNSSQSIKMVLADRQDAQLIILIDEQKTTAKSQIISAHGGADITFDQLMSELKNMKVTYGIQKAVCEKLIQKAKYGNPGSIYSATLAKAITAVDGIDTELIKLVDTAKERMLKPQLQANGKVDMRNLGDLITVKAGQQIMRRIPFIAGKDGVNLSGGKIPHKEAIDQPLLAGEKTEICDKDPNLLIATHTGVPRDIKDGMEVNTILNIENLDVGFGNLNFDGSVVIKGDICEGMKLNATGDITVLGYIDSAEVTCGGDLYVQHSIVGRQSSANLSKNYSCNIDCKGSVTATISQYSRIKSAKDINIKSQLTHCEVRCQGNLNVKDYNGSHGRLVGGDIYAGESINTDTLGTPGGGKITLHLVDNYQEIEGKIDFIKVGITQQESKLADLSIARGKLNDYLAFDEKKQVLQMRILMTIEKVTENIKAMEEQLAEEQLSLQENLAKAKVIACQKVFSDVHIEIGDKQLVTTHEHGPSKFMIEGNKIVATPLS